MRIGWDENSITGVSFAQVLENAGADKITVHARTKEQGYSGKANWDIVRQIKEAVSIPVFVNGDITDKYTAEQALDQTNADGVMIGRGALGKPWILSEIETGKKQMVDTMSLLLQHIDLLLNYYGNHGLFIARKHISWYARGKKNVADFCQRAYAETDIEAVKNLIHHFFKGEE